jgi:hypothetical protein
MIRKIIWDVDEQQFRFEIMSISNALCLQMKREKVFIGFIDSYESSPIFNRRSFDLSSLVISMVRC